MSKEVLLVVELVFNEKGVLVGVIFEVLELVLVIVIKKCFEDEVDLCVEINCYNGSYEIFCCWYVVVDEDYQDFVIEIIVEDVQEQKLGVKVGEVIEEKIEFIEFGCIVVQIVKQVIVQKVCEVECVQVVDVYCEKVGEIIFGIVKKVICDNVIVDFGNNVEVLLVCDQIILCEIFCVGICVCVLLKEICIENCGF